MEKIKKEKIEVVYVYKASDGKEFKEQRECKKYEDFLAIGKGKILNEFKFFKIDNNQIIELQEPEHFCYCVVIGSKYEEYRHYLDYPYTPYENQNQYSLLEREGLYYNDWSNAYSGDHGFNGWELIIPTYNSDNLKLILNQVNMKNGTLINKEND